jgi:hypothetical protein
VDVARGVPGSAYLWRLTGDAQQVDSFPGQRRLVSHRDNCSPYFASWKSKYISTLPSGFLQPVTLRAEPCRIDCGRVVVLFVVLPVFPDVPVSPPELSPEFPPPEFPPLFSPDVPESSDCGVISFAALLPRTPPRTAARITAIAITPPTISHNRFFRCLSSSVPGSGSSTDGLKCSGYCSYAAYAGEVPEGVVASRSARLYRS